MARARALIARRSHRLVDPVGALELLREAVMVSRDRGTRPVLAAALDWSLAPFIKVARPGPPRRSSVHSPAGGPVAEGNNFPEVEAARARIRERVLAVLGDEATDVLVAHGAATTYDEIVEYALHHLDPV